MSSIYSTDHHSMQIFRDKTRPYADCLSSPKKLVTMCISETVQPMSNTLQTQQQPVIIFDWDDTLLNAGKLLSETQAQAITEILKESVRYPFTETWTAPTQATLRQHAGHRFKEKIIPRIMPQIDTTSPLHQEWIEDAYQRFKFYYQQAAKHLFPGIKTMLAELKQAGHILCIASNKSRDLLEEELEITELLSLFTLIKAGDDPALNGNAKPAPDMINHIQADFRTGTRFVMVGDRPYDIDAARSSTAHIQTLTIGIRTKTSFTLNADIELSSAAEITTEMIHALIQEHTSANS